MHNRVPLSRNLITYIGRSIVLVMFVIGVVLIVANTMMKEVNPYNALITYILIPMIIGGGIVLMLIGIGVEWLRRRRKGAAEPHLPVFDMNQLRTRRELLGLAVVLAVFFSVSAVGTYQAFMFTESVEFCGALCHQIMTPEYQAYQHSPHARVKCVECHIGAGASWFVRSKLSGLRQVYRTLTHSFTLPIEVPVRNLRPARETCEQCHWPDKFTGSIEREYWHFAQDKDNTPSRYNMLIKVGGAKRQGGQAQGIHWHTSPQVKIRYWAKDRQRLSIPWVEVSRADGGPTVYRGKDAPEHPPEDEIRVMDCIDCHNRPSHIYRAPEETVDNALAAGVLPRSLPGVKERAVKLLNADYPDKETALKAIEAQLIAAYPVQPGGPVTSASVLQAVTVLTGIYRQSFFPEFKVNWKEYPNHIGHLHFPGCFRCHDGEHKDEKNQVISNNCENCHEFTSQAQGADTAQPLKYETKPFQHPGDDPNLWQGALCTDCHAPGS